VIPETKLVHSFKTAIWLPYEIFVATLELNLDVNELLLYMVD
jgi:hypothetical protein